VLDSAIVGFYEALNMRYAIIVVLAMSVGAPAIFGLVPWDKADNDPNKGWVDQDNLTQTERLKERPGNFQVLAAIYEFFEGCYSVRPDYSRCAFPLQLDATMHLTWDDLQKELDEQTANGERPKNPLRKYNVQIRGVSIHDAEKFSTSDEFKKLRDFEQKKFTDVRKRHPGRAVIAFVQADLESLKATKVESGQMILYLVFAKNRWQVAWYNK
jgi:hypothetical protein